MISFMFMIDTHYQWLLWTTCVGQETTWYPIQGLQHHCKLASRRVLFASASNTPPLIAVVYMAKDF